MNSTVSVKFQIVNILMEICRPIYLSKALKFVGRSHKFKNNLNQTSGCQLGVNQKSNNHILCSKWMEMHNVKICINYITRHTFLRNICGISHIRYSRNALLSKQPYNVGFSRSMSTRSIHEATENKVRTLESKGLLNMEPQENAGELERIARKFPSPKESLHNCFNILSHELNNPKLKLSPKYTSCPGIGSRKGTSLWKCTYHLLWPQEQTFTASMQNKALASKHAALKALHWLQERGKIRSNGVPNIYENSELKNSDDSKISVTVDQSHLEDLDDLLRWYKEDVKPLIEEIKSKNEEDDQCSKYNEEHAHPTLGYISKTFPEKRIQLRNQELLRRYEERKRTSEEKVDSLPIDQHRFHLVKLINENRVVIVKGEPGCGKSTQVPQYIMDDWTRKFTATDCNIIITQPRRISAISLAERVAFERNEKVGDVAGYQVRLQSSLPRPPGGGLLFCTTGILLQRLHSNPNLNGLSHVIVDEAHERDVNTDVLLVLLRRALKANPNLRVVVMSATINAELFKDFFDGASSIHIPGFTYPVKSYFLDDMRQMGIPLRYEPKEEYYNNKYLKDVVAQVILWINKNKPPGAILCFLPGWSEIKTLKNYLEDNLKDSAVILPVHSRLPYHEQRKIFHSPPPGIRKIILATNIAESSITINDISYVVDLGLHKEQRVSDKSDIPCFDYHWISQASVSQRKGRAGRVRPGECFHLYYENKLKSMNQFPIPEIHRIPLEKTVLDCKVYSENERAESFLSEMPEPPSEKSINKAVDDLIQLGALTNEEMLTPLGKRIAKFTTHPKLSKTLIHASIFRCVNPILSICTMLSGDTDIFVGSLLNKESVRETKQIFHPSSDHLALSWLLRQWIVFQAEDTLKAQTFCDEMNLNEKNLRLITQLQNLYAEQLYECLILNKSMNWKDWESNCNSNASNDEFVKALLYSGLNNLLIKPHFDFVRGRLTKKVKGFHTEKGHKAVIATESVNYKRNTFTSPFFVYFQAVHSNERRSVVVRESSMITPLSLLLFTEGDIRLFRSDKNLDQACIAVKIKDKKYINLICEKTLSEKLLNLREVIMQIKLYFIEREGYFTKDDKHDSILKFHDALLDVLNRMLHDAGNAIDCPEINIKSNKK